MVKSNTTIDNINPLITYSPSDQWHEGSKEADPEANRYSNGGTFTLTTVLGASASFSFNGTGIWLFGAKRSNHDAYNVTLDGATTTGNGFAAGDGIFQTPLFGAENLIQGPHAIVLTNAFQNASNPFLDLDFITWESNIGDGDAINATTIDDTDSSFNYQPQNSSWNTDPENVSSYSGSTGHVTNASADFVTYTFQVCDAISLFGAVGPWSGFYDVSLDGGPKNTFNATKQQFAAQQLLYSANGVGPGNHTVRLSPSQNGQNLTIDFAIVSEASTSTTSLPATTNPSQTEFSSTSLSSPSATAVASKINTGLIAGIVVLAVVTMTLIVGLVVFLLRRRRQRHSNVTKPQAFEIDPDTQPQKPPRSLFPLFMKTSHPANGTSEVTTSVVLTSVISSWPLSRSEVTARRQSLTVTPWSPVGNHRRIDARR